MAKKNPCQEIGLGNRGRLKVLTSKWSQMGMSDPLNYLESIWHHSEPLKVPYSQTSMASANFSPLLTPTPSLRQPSAFQQKHADVLHGS